MSTREKLRQGWYALGIVALPVTVHLLDRTVPAYDRLPAFPHLLVALVIGLVMLIVLRLTNPWESSDDVKGSASSSGVDEP